MEIKKTTTYTGIGFPPITEGPLPPSTPPVLDRDFTINRDGVAWKFSDGKVLVGGNEVGHLLQTNPSDLSLWFGLADGLQDYRKKVAKAIRDKSQFARLDSMVEGLLGRIFNGLKKAYSQKMSGFSCSREKGQFILNGFNIKSFLALYRFKKTDKAKKFLKSLKSRLVVFLDTPQEGPDGEWLLETARQLYQEINEELAKDSASSSSTPILLPPPSRSS